ncbi:hypothetical protein BH20ACT4_BH20ACT4_04210 [soil metagenome]
MASALVVSLVAVVAAQKDANESLRDAPTTTVAASTTTLAPTTVAARNERKKARPPTTVRQATLPGASSPVTLSANTLAATTLSPTTVATTIPSTTELTVPPVEAPAEASEGLGSIEIPAIGVTRTMYEGIEMSTLDLGPGHWPGTAMPGEAGNFVMAGHRVSHNADFRDLDQLSPGAEVIFTTASGRYVYSVESTEIVQPDAMWIVDQTSDATATLFACHPPGSISQRIVVHLQLVG